MQRGVQSSSYFRPIRGAGFAEAPPYDHFESYAGPQCLSYEDGAKFNRNGTPSDSGDETKVRQKAFLYT